MSKPKMFNPFGGGDTAADNKPKEAAKKPYETTGDKARDSVRKTIFDAFIQEGSEESVSARVAETIEDAISS